MKTIYVGIFAFIWPLALFIYLKADMGNNGNPFSGPGFLGTPEPAQNARPIDGIYPAEGANSTIYAGPGKANPAIVVSQEDQLVYFNKGIVTPNIKVNGAFETDGDSRVKFDKGLETPGATVETLTILKGALSEGPILSKSISSTSIKATNYKTGGRTISPITMVGMTREELGEVTCQSICGRNEEQLCLGVIGRWSGRAAGILPTSNCYEKSAYVSHCLCMPFWKICEEQGDCFLNTENPNLFEGNPNPKPEILDSETGE